MTAAIPDTAFRQFLEQHFPADAAAPFVVALCSSGVPCSGELFSVGGGIAARVALGYVPGVVLGAGARPEDYLQHFADVLSERDMRIARTAMDEVSFRAEQLGVALGNPHEAPDWSNPGERST
jgi:hypothetical protein